MNWLKELEHLANRGYTEGFYRRHVPAEYQNYEKGVSNNTAQQFVGEAMSYDKETGWLTVEAKNRFGVNDTLELITPEGNQRFQLSALTNQKGKTIELAPGSGHIVKLAMPNLTLDESGSHALLMKHLQP